MTTTTETLAAALERHELTADWRGDGMHRDPDGWEHHRYRFTLAHRGEPFIIDAVYRVGLALDEPTAADIFGSVLQDAASVEAYVELDPEWGWIEWCDDLNGLDRHALDAERRRRGGLGSYFREQRDAFRECVARGELIHERVGDDAYRELTEIAAEL